MSLHMRQSSYIAICPVVSDSPRCQQSALWTSHPSIRLSLGKRFAITSSAIELFRSARVPFLSRAENIGESDCDVALYKLAENRCAFR